MIDVEQHGSITAIRMARAVLGRPLYWTGAYWIDGLLIDTGPMCTAEELLRVLEQLPVEQVAITHSHEDHIGGLALICKRYPDVPVFASRQAIPLIEDPSLLKLQTYRRLIWGAPSPVKGMRSLDDVDDMLRTKAFTFRAVETPGHSRDHVSYFEPHRRWVFSGDAFIGGRDVAWPPDYDMFAVISSMRALASLRPERLFPGSGHVRRTPLPDLHGKITALIQLSNQVMKLDADGHSAPEIVAMLFNGEPRMRLWTMGHFSAANLVEACRSYSSLMAPADLTEFTPSSSSDQWNDMTGSSANRPAGPGDIRR